MSRVFEAMRRLNAVAAETPAATAEVLEDFVLEDVRPSSDEADESPSPRATLWSEPARPTASPADRRPVLENKHEKMARSFSELLRDIARDEQEQGH